MRGCSMSAVVGLLVVALVPSVASACPAGQPAPAAVQDALMPTRALYGNPWAADGLANLEIGRYGREVDYRFRSEASGTLSSVRVFFVFGSSYSGGNGGDIRVTLESDAAGSPSGNVLASGLVTDPISQGHFRTIPLSGATVTAGQLYHLHFVNVDPSQTRNWVSTNNLQTAAGVQCRIPDSDLAVLHRDGVSASWVHNTAHTPIVTLFHADGSAHGPGAPYVNARRQGGLRDIAGPDQVGELFTVTGASKLVRSASFLLHKSGNPGALTIRLRTAGGETIDSVTVGSSQVASGTSWVTGTFSAPRMLTAGEQYRLELSAPAGDAYQAWPLTQGPGFESPAMFTDGVWQYSTTGGLSWQIPSTADDAQFYLTQQGDAIGHTGVSPPGTSTVNTADRTAPEYAVVPVQSDRSDARANRLTVLAGCGSACRVSAELRVARQRTPVLGRARATLAAQRSRAIRVKLTRRGRAALRRASTLRAKLRVTVDGAGAPLTLNRSIVLREIDVGRFARRGLAFAGRCSERCSIAGDLLMRARDARRHGLRAPGSAPVRVAGATATSSASANLVLRVKKASRKRLARARRVNLTMEASVRAPTGPGHRTSYRLTLRR